MIDQGLLRSVRAELAALDFSDEVERISELRSEIADLEGAIEAGRARMAEIDRHGAKASPAPAVADALLSGGSIATITRADESLAAERKALPGALADLQARIRAKEIEISQIQTVTKEKFEPVARPLVDEIMRAAREAGEEIRQCLAGLEAVYAKTLTGGNELAALRRGVEGITADYTLLPRTSAVAAPASLEETLAVLQDKVIPRPDYQAMRVT
jgi:hypothetical protein